jgi:hypothetical protein
MDDGEEEDQEVIKTLSIYFQLKIFWFATIKLEYITQVENILGWRSKFSSVESISL